MENVNQIVNQISLTMGVAWASGINLYAAILMLGGLGMTGNIILPPDLQVLQIPSFLVLQGLCMCWNSLLTRYPEQIQDGIRFTHLSASRLVRACNGSSRRCQ